MIQPAIAPRNPVGRPNTFGLPCDPVQHARQFSNAQPGLASQREEQIRRVGG
ncbi:MAG: hypothetical protein JWN15_2256 [Firmicutes bacterium]|nr:hypothetical protein [Bacillota bacterium]